jgi:hypothetical protein
MGDMSRVRRRRGFHTDRMACERRILDDIRRLLRRGAPLSEIVVNDEGSEYGYDPDWERPWAATRAAARNMVIACGYGPDGEEIEIFADVDALESAQAWLRRTGNSVS